MLRQLDSSIDWMLQYSICFCEAMGLLLGNAEGGILGRFGEHLHKEN